MPKTDIHPQYFKEAAITCTCGATHAMGSTKDALRLDICSNCHPFYSGNQKLIDTAGRVDRFREKMATAETMQGQSKKSKVKSQKSEAVQEKTEDVKPEVEAPVEAPVEVAEEETVEVPHVEPETAEVADEAVETESNEEIQPSEEGSDEEVVASDASDDAGKEA